MEKTWNGALAPHDVRRRALVRGGALLATTAGLAALGACGGNEDSPLANTPTPTPSGTVTPVPTETPALIPLTDTDVLLLLLQISYWQAEFYSRAVLGIPLSSVSTGGAAAADVVGSRAVTFTTATAAETLREIAFDKIAQVDRLRAILGSAAVPRPALNLAVDATGAFTQLAQESKLVTAPATFDFYAGEDQFLLAAFVVENTALVAFKGVLPQLQMVANTVAVAGILSTLGFHTAFVRSQLYIRGLAAGNLSRQRSILLSDRQDSYSPVDDDQGVSGGSATTANANANITDADSEGVIYGRPPQFTVNVLYQTRIVTDRGGFFPNGLAGTIRQSALT